MSYENKGSMATTVTVSMEPDRSGNFICDGTADDVQIQAAVDYVIAVGGGKVTVKAGDYEITNEILIQSIDNLVLEGVGWRETIFTTSGVDTTAITIGDRVNAGEACQNIVIRDLYIDGTSQTTETETPEINDRRFGIQFASPAEETSDILIENCYIYNTGSDSIYGFNADRFIAQNNIIEGTRGYWAAIHCHGSPNDGQVIGNIIFNCSCTGIRHSRIISNNHVEECAKASVTDGREASIVGSPQSVITGNWVSVTAVGGIAIKTFGAYNTVVGNWARSARSYCIYVHAYDSHAIVGNLAYDMGSPTGHGMRVFESSGCTIEGNVFDYLKGNGIDIYGSSNCTVANNVISGASKDDDNTWDAIILQSSNGTHSTNNVIKGNQIYSEEGNLPRYGINENDANQDYNVYQNNVIQNTSTALAKILGPNSRLPKAQFQFTEPIVGAIVNTSPTGVDVDVDTEGALAWGQIPVEAQEVQRIKIWAVATDAPIGAGGQMHLEIIFNAGASNAVYNEAGKSWTLANFDGEEADYVANDVVHWVVYDADVSNEILALKPGDSFEIFAMHEAGADPDGATDALFRVVEVEYV